MPFSDTWHLMPAALDLGRQPSPRAMEPWAGGQVVGGRLCRRGGGEHVSWVRGAHRAPGLGSDVFPSSNTSSNHTEAALTCRQGVTQKTGVFQTSCLTSEDVRAKAEFQLARGTVGRVLRRAAVAGDRFGSTG